MAIRRRFDSMGHKSMGPTGLRDRPHLRRLLPLALLLLVAQLGTSRSMAQPGAPASAGELRHLVILHTNDIHGQVLPRPATWLKDVNPLPNCGGLPRLCATLNRLRAEIEAGGAEVLLVDGGDWYQGTPEGNQERGRPFLAALAQTGHDALVVGNHEFDHGVDVLLDHIEATGLPALLANVRDAQGKPLAGTRDVHIVERLGLRIALVGLLTPRTPEITHASTKSLHFEDPAVALERVRAELGDDVQWILPVCHVGVEDERALAAACPWLDVVVGGHSHTFLRKGIREGRTLVVQTGAKASAIGRVDVWFDAAGRVVKSEAQLIDLYDEPGPEFRSAGVDEACAALVARADAAMNAVVGVLGRPLSVSRRPRISTSAGNCITDLMRERTGAAVAIHNRGGIRTTLPAGPVTRRDLFMLLPFANHIVTFDLEGRALREILRRSIEDPKGRPFEFSGMTAVVRLEAGQPKLVEVRVGDDALDPARRYRVTTNSFLAQGNDGLVEFAEASTREIDFTVLRDLLEQGFAGGALVPALDQRYEVLR